MNLALLDAFRVLAAPFTGCTVFWPNEGAEPPRDGNGMPAPFIQCTIEGLATDILSMGSIGAHQLQDDGFIKVDIMVPKGTGTDQARTFADSFAALFRVTAPSSVPGLQTLAPTQLRSGADTEDGNYYGLTFTIPYWVIYQG